MKQRFSLQSITATLALLSIILGLGGPGTDIRAAPPPPAAPREVSVAAEGSNLSIYVTDSGGGNQRRVAQVDMANAPLLLRNYVALSPDGGSVAYVTMDDPYTRANTVLWIARADGSETQAVATFPEGFWLAAPLWSPDAQQIAYILERPTSDPDQRLELWIMDRDGGGQKSVLQGDPLRPDLFSTSARPLSWSADGRYLELNDETSTPPILYQVDHVTQVITQAMAEKDPEHVLSTAEPLANLPCSVQLWHQNDYGDIMQTCGYSIATAGCALTSAAMVFKYYGVNTNPPALNQCLGTSACPIYWGTAASRCSEGKVAFVASQGFSYSTIDQDLASGRPVIVYLTRYGNTHFVVVTGGAGQNPSGYSINDPWHYSTLRQTLAPYTNEGWSLTGLRRFSGTPSCADPDGGDISYGQTRNGTINPAYDYDDFYFNATAGDIVEIHQNKNGSALDSYLRLYDQNGSLVAYDDDTGGDLNSFIRRTLSSGGRYRIRAMAYSSSTGAYSLSLALAPGGCGGDCEGDPRWIAFGQTLYGTIQPNSDRDIYYFNGTTERVVGIRMNRTSGTLDPILELWSPSGVRLAYNDDGGGYPNSWIVYTLPANGTYRISAYSYSLASSGTYSIQLSPVTSSNLAQGSPVTVSSVEASGLEGWRATDGNMGTRWSSQFSDPQWIYVDLGQSRTFSQVVLKWETAYARRYGLCYWTGSAWRYVYWTDYGNGGTDTINFSPVTARYVAMYGAQRGTPWGYSLWEFEVYDRSTTVIPEVPPDDPEKDPNTAPEEEPLPPTLNDKPVQLSGDGETGQEDMPLQGEPTETMEAEIGAGQTVVAYINSPDADGLFRLYTPAGYVLFAGEGQSENEDGPLAITAYEWRSDRQGTLGTQQSFTLPDTSLMPGLHTIYLRVQNELGTWSEEVSIELLVQWPHSIFLPLVQR